MKLSITEKVALVMLTPLLLAIAMASCAGLPIDRAMSAEAGNDPSVIFCGPDGKCHAHYAYVQVPAGAGAGDELAVKVPGVSCSRDACIGWQIITPSGSFGTNGAVKKGQTEFRVPISAVIGHDTAAPGDDNEYRIVLDVYFNDSAGKEHLIRQHGLIRVEVLDAAYQPVGCNDPAIAWDEATDSAGKCRAQWTTQLRSALCGGCGEG